MNPKEPDFGPEFEGISPQCIALLRDQLLAKVCFARTRLPIRLRMGARRHCGGWSTQGRRI